VLETDGNGFASIGHGTAAEGDEEVGAGRPRRIGAGDHCIMRRVGRHVIAHALPPHSSLDDASRRVWGALKLARRTSTHEPISYREEQCRAREMKYEHRMTMEAIVDAYNSAERAMGWYYYLHDKMKVPFKRTETRLCSCDYGLRQSHQS
jgi:hypothetical protein